MSHDENSMDKAARHIVELGNELDENDPQTDMRDIADGLLAGAVHYWLYANQPCSDAMCEDCVPVGTAELRLAEMKTLLEEFARDSDYLHAANDTNVGRAKRPS